MIPSGNFRIALLPEGLGLLMKNGDPTFSTVHEEIWLVAIWDNEHFEHLIKHGLIDETYYYIVLDPLKIENGKDMGKGLVFIRCDEENYYYKRIKFDDMKITYPGLN